MDALITMFIVLTGENWNYVMATVALAHPDLKLLSIFFFCSAVLIGNFMLLNLFLAILLKFLQDAVADVANAEKLAKTKKQMEEDKLQAILIDQEKDKKFKEKIHGTAATTD